MSDVISSPRPRSRGFLLSLFVLSLLVFAGVTLRQSIVARTQLSSLTVSLEQLYGGPASENPKATIIIGKVRRLMELPEGVEPMVATIVDVEKLREQNPFYANAENGDSLLITPTRAILYRESLDKIIDVTIVTIEPQASSSDGEEQAPEGEPQE